MINFDNPVFPYWVAFTNYISQSKITLGFRENMQTLKSISNTRGQKTWLPFTLVIFENPNGFDFKMHSN